MDSLAASTQIGPTTLSIPERGLDLEWLLTDGTGSYASSTVLGCNTRKYHGLLVAAARPPGDRVVLLASLQAELEAAGRRFALSTTEYPGVLHPDGYRRLISFRLAPLPEWTYALGGALLRQRIVPLRGRRAFVIAYDLRGATDQVVLRLRPVVAGRGFHGLMREGATFEVERGEQGQVIVRSSEHSLPLYLRAAGGVFVADPTTFRRVTYRRERERGFDAEEDLFSPGAFEVTIVRGHPFVLAAGGEPLPDVDFDAVHAAECARLQGLVDAAQAETPLERALVLAADTFIVESDGGALAGLGAGEGRAVIAGYPWFDAWGRDAFIALEGLTLATNRFADARAVLLTFAARARDGMMPNYLAAEPAHDAFNSIDAGLWFIDGVYRYLRYTGDTDIVRANLWPRVVGILEAYLAGTRFGIRVDADGLVTGGNAETQLTWMDAQVGGRPVTARQGKAVEVNALWYNALRAAAAMAERLGLAEEPTRWERHARIARKSFNAAFWCEETQSLYDVLPEAGAASRRQVTASCAQPAYVVPGLRPNAVLAVSLPWPVLAAEHWRAAVEGAQRRLLTPWGLRTLAPEDPAYRGRYSGTPQERDSAYHQGTAWPWLLGPFYDAYLRVQRHTAAARSHVREALDVWSAHLLDAGLGTVSEIFDGAPPHLPVGCIAQAWSVAEILRLLRLTRAHSANSAHAPQPESCALGRP
jgi:predicted glycogen debranching enzyme